MRLYLNDFCPQHGRARVVAHGDDGCPFVELDCVYHHPRGGGQLEDLGSVDGVPVIDVRHGPDQTIRHYLGGPPPPVGSVVEVVVDSVRREMSRRLHTAGHAIAGQTECSFPGLQAASGHHWPGEARVTFTGQSAVEEEAIGPLLQGRLDALGDRRVRVVGDPQASRAIEIAGFAPVPCGGTHVQQLSEVGRIIITHARFKKGQLRVSYTVA